MLDQAHLQATEELLLNYDPNLTAEDAAHVAASIGDTPVIIDGSVIAKLNGAEYPIPQQILFPDEPEEEDPAV